jgi:hypothetical protein
MSNSDPSAIVLQRIPCMLDYTSLHATSGRDVFSFFFGKSGT